MIKRVFHWMIGAAVSSIFVLIYLLLFHTNLFSGLVLHSVNRILLSPMDLLAKGNIQGGLLSNRFGVDDFVLLRNDRLILSATSIRALNPEIDWEMRALSLERLDIDSLHVDPAFLNGLDRPENGSQRAAQLSIKEVFVNKASVTMELGSEAHRMDISDLSGNVWMYDGHLGVHIRSGRIEPHLGGLDTILVQGNIGGTPTGKIMLNNSVMVSERGRMILNGELSKSGMDLQLALHGLKPAGVTSYKLPAYYDEAALSGAFHVVRDTASTNFTGSGSFSNRGEEVPFTIHQASMNRMKSHLNARIGSNLNYADVTWEFDSSGTTSGWINLFLPNLNPFIPTDTLRISQTLGTISVNGVNSHYELQAQLDQTQVNGIRFDSLQTHLIHDANLKFTFDQGQILQGNNRLEFHGSLSKDSLSMLLRAQVRDYDFLAHMPNSLDLSGEMEASLEISGSPVAPVFSGNFLTRDLGVQDKLQLTGSGKFDLQYERERLLGVFAMQGKQGRLFKEALRQFNISTVVTEDAYVLEDFHLQANSNLVSAGGRFSKSGIRLGKLNILSEGDQLKLVNSVEIDRSTEGVYSLPQTLLSFNQGAISFEGDYAPDSGLHVQSKFEMIDMGQLMDFFKLKVDFKGLTHGEALIRGPLFDPSFDVRMFFTEGSTLGYPSDSAYVDLTLSARNVRSHEIKAFSRGGKLRLLGDLPWGYKLRGDDYKYSPQNFSINVDNYLLSDIKLTSIAGLPLKGRSTGILTIRGTPMDTKMDGRVELTDARYDTLAFSSGHVDFGYEDDLMTFDSLSMVSTWGYGHGSGYLPLSLDMVAASRIDVRDREVGLQFDFNLNEMPFLTAYISSIDAIQGDFIGSLSFSGPFRAPIRDGKIRGHNASLEISVLGNPITDIHAEVTLQDNTMTIDHFSGKMLFSQGSALNMQGGLGWATSKLSELIGVKVAQNYAGDVEVSGKIDFTSFFQPRFDVRVEADEVYYRSTDGLIEAIADADLHFSGRDTLDVTAVIPVSRATYFANFESGESYQEEIKSIDSSLFKYSLNTQFASDLLISNDQLEAEFEGELWLLDYGDGIMRFSGTLTAQEGGKFYYLGNELAIGNGQIIFNSVDFNPQLNMEATIEIDGELVTLILSGDLDEPELVIQADNTNLTQSDVLAYLTINQKLVEVSFDTRSALNPVKTYSEMLVEKQISKLGREFTGLDILDVGINLDSDTTAVSRFEVGQRLSKNLKVTYGGELQTVTGKSDYDFGLEYQINQNVSVTSRINQNGEVELNGRLKFSY